MKRFIATLLVFLIAMQIPMMSIGAATLYKQQPMGGTSIIDTPQLSQGDEDNQEIILDTDESDTQNTDGTDTQNTVGTDIQKSGLLEIAENPTTLKSAPKKGKPSNLSAYTNNDDNFIDWNKADLKWWFQWDSKLENIASAVWQVSVVKFADNPTDWKNPTGLVASGKLNSSQKEFYIDFAGFCQTKQKWSEEYSKNTTMPYIKNVLQMNKSKIITSKNQVTFNNLLKEASRIAALKTDLLKGVNLNNKKELNLKLVELTKNLATSMNATQKKTYYVRVVALDKQGKSIKKIGRAHV